MPMKATVMKEMKAAGGLCIFTDGSGCGGGVGVVAVTMRGGDIGEHRAKHLGSLMEHTVFESKVADAILSLNITSSFPPLMSSWTVELPSQPSPLPPSHNWDSIS
jgi:hypothetical protein